MTIWKDARSEETELVRTARLDDLEAVTRQLTEKTLLKIDVQGSEMRVLAGAMDSLQKIEMIEVELTVTPLYDGQPLIVEILRYLDDRGFMLVSLDPIPRDFKTGHYYQFDGILLRD